jgi:hypothetical protein
MVFGSGTIVAQLAGVGLIDEYQIAVIGWDTLRR